MVVGDDQDGRVEPIGLAVQRRERLPVASPADHEVAFDLGGIEDVQRPAVVERHEIGDVDQGIDGPQPDRGQPPLHPGGRCAVPDAAHETKPECRAEMLVFGREIEPHRDRLREPARDGGSGDRLQPAKSGRREVARDAMDAGGIGAVRRERHVDHRIVKTRIGPVRHADRCVLGELDDSVVLLGEFELRRRAQHAVRFDPADNARRDGQVLARNIGPRGREDADEAGPRIGRAADDLDGRAASRIDRADPQPIGIGVLHGLDDAGHREAAQSRSRVDDTFDFEADAGQSLSDVGESGLDFEVILEPGEGEFHSLRRGLISVT